MFVAESLVDSLKDDLEDNVGNNAGNNLGNSLEDNLEGNLGNNTDIPVDDILVESIDRGANSDLDSKTQCYQMKLLGTFQFNDWNGNSVLPNSYKARCVLLYLALSEDHEVNREQLAHLLWRRHARDQARASLRQALTQIKKCLPTTTNVSVIHSTSRSLALNRQCVELDIDVFKKADQKVWSHLLLKMHAYPNLLERMDSKEQNIQSWIDQNRTQLREQQERFWEMLLGSSAAFNIEHKQHIARQLLQLKPAHEKAVKMLITFSMQESQLNDALEIYQKYAQYLKTTLNTEPSENIKQLLIPKVEKKNSIGQPEADRSEASMERNQQKSVISTGDTSLDMLSDASQRKTGDFERAFFKRDSITIDSVKRRPIHKNYVQLQKNHLCQKIKQFWLEGVLNPIKQESTWVAMRFADTSQVIPQPYEKHRWRYCIKKNQSQPIPEYSQNDLLTQMKASLLILGEPGAGKTVALLEMADQWLLRYEQHTQHSSDQPIDNHELTKPKRLTQDSFEQVPPIPIILPLSSWTKKQATLESWLHDQLDQKYNVPKSATEALLQSNVLLMLDGLDEVEPKQQQDCVDCLNHFMQNFPTVSLVVTCRSQEYHSLSKPLALDRAVTCLPLRRSDVERALSKKENHTGLLNKMKSDESLWPVLNTPLMLYIAQQVYTNPTNDVNTKQYQSLHSQSHHSQFLKASMTDHSDASTVDTMCLPKTTMKTQEHVHQRCDDMFERYTQVMYQRCSDKRYYPQEKLTRWLSYLSDRLHQQQGTLFHVEWLQPEFLAREWQQNIVSVGSVVVCAIVVAFIISIAGMPLIGFGNALLVTLMIGIPGSLMVGLLGCGDEIKPFTRFCFSFRYLKDRFLQIVITGMLSALVLGIGIYFVLGLHIALCVAVLKMMMFLVFGMLDVDSIRADARNITQPNEGIHQSFRYGAIAMLVGAALGAFIGMLFQSTYAVLSLTMLSGVMLALYYGWHSVIQHVLLRIIIVTGGYGPWNYVRFLEEAVSHAFLRKVGGGYMFLHRDLQEFFSNGSNKRGE